MVVEAISSADVRNNYQISFGKRNKGQKSTTPAVTSPLKAVPVAVLIAMSPMTTTNAKEIMNPRSEVAELVQDQGKNNVIYSHTFNTEKLTGVKVQAINTKGNLDGFDKININWEDYAFEVKDVAIVSLYASSADGFRDGPMVFRKVSVTLPDRDDITYEFIDPGLTAYVAALANSKENKSPVKSERQIDYNVVPDDLIEGLRAITNDAMNDLWYKGYPNPYKISGNRIDAFEKNFIGTNGRYTLRFYDTNGNKNTYEFLSLQREGEKEYEIESVLLYDSKVSGLDANVDFGTINAIGIGARNSMSGTYILDDDLANYLYNMIQKEAKEGKFTGKDTDIKKENYEIDWFVN